VVQHAPGRAVHVFELPLVGHSQEHPGGAEDGDDAERDQQIKGFHQRDPPDSRKRGSSRSALSATSSELADMPIAATAGGTSPTAAVGIASVLYNMAHPRFCLTIRRVAPAR